MKRRKRTHGGARQGAGRPKTKGVILQIKITPSQKAWLVERAGGGKLTDVVVAALVAQGAPT